MKSRPFFPISIISLICFLLISCGDQTRNIKYSTGVWDSDSLGYHRIVLKAEKKGDANYAHIEWRRRDNSPEGKGFILVDGTTNKRILNVISLSINKEAGDIIFQPQTIPSM